MAAPKFTPAPWVWHTSNSWKRLKRDDRGISMNVLEPFVHWRDQHPDCTVSEADMALIAAAPELYEALDFIFEHIADKERGFRDLYPAFGLDGPRAIEMARNALAKARGEP